MITRHGLSPALLVGAALLAGCTVGTDFVRPAPPPGTAYLAPADMTPDDAQSPPASGAVSASTQWWRELGSPQLNALVAQALANNQELAASNATLERARQLARAAAGLRLPQIDVTAAAERRRENLAAFGLAPDALAAFGDNPTFNLYSLGATVSFDADLFGGRRRKREQAAAAAEAQLHQTEAAHLTVAGHVVSEVLTIATLRTRLGVLRALVAQDEDNLRLTNAKVRAGSGTLVETFGAQSQLALDRGEISTLVQKIDEARHMLAVLIGLAPAQLAPTDFELASFTLPRPVPVAIPSALVRSRPDILQAEADLHAARAAVGVATSRLYPDLSLGGSVAQGSTAVGTLLSSGTRGFDIFVNLTAPLFRGGTLKAEQRAAQAEARAAGSRYQRTVLEAFRQVADLLAASQNDRQAISDRGEAVAIAARSRSLSHRSFDAGNSGILQVLDAERVYQRARFGLIDAQAQQLADVVRLYVATAGDWTAPQAGLGGKGAAGIDSR